MAQLQKLQGLQSAGGQLALSAVPDGAVETDHIGKSRERLSMPALD